MEITFLGSGTGFPNKNRASPGILLKLPKLNILWDSGPGTMRQLAKLNLTTNDIDIIMFTHLHPDHTIDLIDFLFSAKYQVVPGTRTVRGKSNKSLPKALNQFITWYNNKPGRDGFRTKPLHLIGPTGFKSFYNRMINLYGQWLKTSTYPLKISEVKNTQLLFNGWKLKTALMEHEKYSVGYRIETKGKVLVYSGDTSYCANIVKLGRDADILILECSTSDEVNLPFHLKPRDIARITRESSAKKVILTHIYQVADEFDLLKQVRSNWPKIPAGKVSLAHDLMRVKM